jgi:hypothetical protein
MPNSWPDPLFPRPATRFILPTAKQLTSQAYNQHDILLFAPSPHKGGEGDGEEKKGAHQTMRPHKGLWFEGNGRCPRKYSRSPPSQCRDNPSLCPLPP